MPLPFFPYNCVIHSVYLVQPVIMLIWVPENREGVTESVSLGYDTYALQIQYGIELYTQSISFFLIPKLSQESACLLFCDFQGFVAVILCGDMGWPCFCAFWAIQKTKRDITTLLFAAFNTFKGKHCH